MIHQNLVGCLTPVIQCQCFTKFHTEFGAFKENRYQAIQGINFIIRQIILGNVDVLLPDPGSLPRSEGHIGLRGIGAGNDKISSRLTGYGIDQFVLGFRKEMLCIFFRADIICRQSEQVAQFLIESLFAGTDVTDLFQ